MENKDVFNKKKKTADYLLPNRLINCWILS
jgi:hypothetical protein